MRLSRRSPAQPVSERSGVGIRVERDDPITPMESERVTHEKARGRLAHAALAGYEGNPATAQNGRLDLRDELSPTELGRAW